MLTIIKPIKLVESSALAYSTHDRMINPKPAIELVTAPRARNRAAARTSRDGQNTAANK